MVSYVNRVRAPGATPYCPPPDDPDDPDSEEYPIAVASYANQFKGGEVPE